MDLRENFTADAAVDKEELIKFWNLIRFWITKIRKLKNFNITIAVIQRPRPFVYNGLETHQCGQ